MPRTPDAWEGATVIIDAGGNTSARPAAFVFPLGEGLLAWVEPSYADPYGAASTALHTCRNMRPDPSGQGLVCDGAGWTATLLPYDPEDHRDLIGGAMDWFSDWLKKEDRTWAQEREQMRSLLGF